MGGVVPLAVLQIRARLDLVSTADEEKLSQTTFNGLLFSQEKLA